MIKPIPGVAFFVLQFLILAVAGFLPASTHTITSPRNKAFTTMKTYPTPRASKKQSSGDKNLHRDSVALNAVGRGSGTQDGSTTTKYDVIVVGSGNGACALLNECLANAPKNKDYKILVIEQGRNFFYTSDVTHQNGWSKSYATADIFKLHNAMTSDGKAVISGKACTQGGGGR